MSRFPGRKAPVHLGYDLKPGYVHPDSVDVDYAHKLEVIAIDAKTGRIAWQRTAYDGPMYDDRHRKNTYASSTMATDGRQVYAYFESGGVYAFGVDGAPKWQVSLGGMAKAGLGPGTSPVLFDDLVILQCDQEMGEGSFIVALRRKDGKEAWRAARHDAAQLGDAVDRASRRAGRAELIASGAEQMIAYNPATGEVLWRANGTESHPIPSPVAGHGLVFMTAGSQAQTGARDPAGPIRRSDQHRRDRVALRQGHRLRAVTHTAR